LLDLSFTKEIEMISILMPVKNAALFLDECIESILNQNYKDWELIAIDDHSTDDSFLTLTRFTNDSRIKVFKSNGNGIIDALSQAFEVSEGDFIHRMDADDIMPQTKLESLFNLLQGRLKFVATGNVSYFSDHQVSAGYRDYEQWLNSINNYKAEIYRECVIASPNWLVHRSCFEKDILFHELTYPEDYDMCLKWYALGYEIIKTDELTHLWREHPQRTSRHTAHYQQKAFFELKTKYFIKKELDENDQVQVVGGGQKAKILLKLLTKMGQKYNQFDVKNSRVDSNQEIKPVSELQSNQKTILCNWPKDVQVQQEIIHFLKSKRLEIGKNLWVF
jgi:glycosyltransferase involved in cell wall biosynthesis